MYQTETIETLCGHFFHLKCAEDHIRRELLCPICSRAMKFSDLEAYESGELENGAINISSKLYKG